MLVQAGVGLVGYCRLKVGVWWQLFGAFAHLRETLVLPWQEIPVLPSVCAPWCGVMATNNTCTSAMWVPSRHTLLWCGAIQNQQWSVFGGWCCPVLSILCLQAKYCSREQHVTSRSANDSGGQSWIHLQLSICRSNAFPIPTQDLLPTIFCPSAAVRNCIPFRFDITVAWQLKAAVWCSK